MLLSHAVEFLQNVDRMYSFSVTFLLVLDQEESACLEGFWRGGEIFATRQVVETRAIAVSSA